MTLPRDETAFFGRQDELGDLDRRIAGGARLVTIAGLAGIGKTRLALQAAASNAKRWKLEPVAFASLAGAPSLEAAVREVARAAGVRVASESKAAPAIATLGASLAKKGAMLLVLDAVEQLSAGPAKELVSGLLDAARELRILATSREVIGVKGEEKLMLAPLGEADARALFLERAKTAAGGSVPASEAEADAIVARVDRLPLAIELAASRLEMLSPSDLLARLGARLDVLSTMRATLDMSWELLSKTEQSVLVQVATFAAPFGIDAAEEIVEIDEGEVLDVLESLLRKSLVVRAEGPRGRARLVLFETVRAWAREKRTDDGVKKRHAAYHLAEAERWATKTYGAEGVRALDELTELFPDLLVAFETTKESEPERATRIVLALSDLLLFRGLFELRAELFAAGAEAAARANDDRLLSRALVTKARVTLEVGRMQDAENELRKAHELATKIGDDATRAEATRSLGWALTAMGRIDEAEKALADATALHKEQGSARGLADAQVALGILRAFQGKSAEALSLLRGALAIHVEQGDVIRQEKVLGFGKLIGHAASEVARGLPREVLARAGAAVDALPPDVAALVATEREAGERWRQAIELYAAGAAAHERGDVTGAIAAFERAASALGRAGVVRGAAAIDAHAATAFAETGDKGEAEARIARARSLAKDDVASELAVEVFAAAVAVTLETESAASAKALLERASAAEGASPELAQAQKVLARALARREGGPQSIVRREGLVVGPESRFMIAPGGERVDLVRYGPVRRLLDRLVTHRLESPGNALSADALIEAGWPGERMRHTAGLLRVYSAIRRLRRLGLESVLVTRDDGYLLDPHAEVRRD